MPFEAEPVILGPSAGSRALLFRTLLTTIAGAALAAAATAFGATTRLPAFGAGLYSSADSFSTLSYLTGISYAQGDETRGFLLFDLTALPVDAQVTGATLRVENLDSADADLRVYGLPYTEAGNFGLDQAPESKRANFVFIGSDITPLFGQSAIPPNTGSSFIELTINGAGVADLNANRADTYYAYGMRTILADVQEPKPLQFAFGGMSQLSIGQQAQLIVEHTNVPGVPEASTGWLMMLGGLMLVAERLRRMPARAAGEPRSTRVPAEVALRQRTFVEPLQHRSLQ